MDAVSRAAAGAAGRSRTPTTTRCTAPAVQPVVRTNFADTAFWAAAVTTAADGTAEVEFTLPESLTTWKVKGWAMGPGTKVGQAETEIVTTKDLLVRLQAPRFFVEKDEVVLVGQRAQQAQDEEGRPGRARARWQRPRAAGRDGADRRDRGGLGAPGRLAGEGRPRGPGRHPDEGPDRRRVRRGTDELPGLCARHAQDGGLRRRDPAGPGEGAGRRPRPGRTQAGAVAAGSAVFAHPGRRPGRRPPLSRRLSLWLHRADLESVPADGHHPEGLDQPGRRSEDDSRQAHQPERPADR